MKNNSDLHQNVYLVLNGYGLLIRMNLLFNVHFVLRGSFNKQVKNISTP